MGNCFTCIETSNKGVITRCGKYDRIADAGCMFLNPCACENVAGLVSLKIQEVGSYHAMFACTAAGTCVSVMPKSVADTLSHLGSVEEHELMTVDTHLACRPGFATLAFLEWRKRLLAASNIEPATSA